MQSTAQHAPRSAQSAPDRMAKAGSTSSATPLFTMPTASRAPACSALSGLSARARRLPDALPGRRCRARVPPPSISCCWLAAAAPRRLYKQALAGRPSNNRPCKTNRPLAPPALHTCHHVGVGGVEVLVDLHGGSALRVWGLTLVCWALCFPFQQPQRHVRRCAALKPTATGASCRRNQLPHGCQMWSP